MGKTELCKAQTGQQIRAHYQRLLAPLPITHGGRRQLCRLGELFNPPTPTSFWCRSKTSTASCSPPPTVPTASTAR
ncbi:MAG: hypothetical protein ACTHXI_07075 [Halomonadaceae bacterium]